MNIVNDENETIKMAKLAGFDIVRFNGVDHIALGGRISHDGEFDKLIQLAQEIERKKWINLMSAS